MNIGQPSVDHVETDLPPPSHSPAQLLAGDCGQSVSLPPPAQGRGQPGQAAGGGGHGGGGEGERPQHTGGPQIGASGQEKEVSTIIPT